MTQNICPIVKFNCIILVKCTCYNLYSENFCLELTEKIVTAGGDSIETELFHYILVNPNEKLRVTGGGKLPADNVSSETQSNVF